MDLESGLFRMLDEGLAAYLAVEPDTVSVRLDWSDRLVADMVAARAMPEPEAPPEVEIPSEDAGHELPPALAALVEERRRARLAAAEAAVRATVVVLPPPTWREIQDRAASVGVEATLLADGGRLHLVAELPAVEAGGEGAS
jgi:hypothetical protein